MKLIKNIKTFIFNPISFINEINERNHLIGKSVVVITRIFLLVKFNLSTNLKQLLNKSKYGKLKLNKRYFVDPKFIKLFLRNRLFYKWNYSMRILDGDWDKKAKPIMDLLAYRAIYKVYKGGKQWKDTDLYNLLPENVENKNIWTFTNIEQRDLWIESTINIYKLIKKFGYKTQEELYKFKDWFINKEWRPVIDEIAVAIDRNGQFLFINGKHRISIATVLDIPKIPVVIIIRHKKWLKFRKELFNLSKNKYEKKLEFNFTHPDLLDIPSKGHQSSFKILRDNISINKGTLLDMTPNLGYFCHKFEDEGFKCYAFDKDKSDQSLLKKIKRAEEKDFEVITIEPNQNIDLNIDIILNYNFYQFYNSNEKYLNNFLTIINKIKAKEVFLGFAKSNTKNNETEQIINEIILNSYLNAANLIGNGESANTLYKLYLTN